MPDTIKALVIGLFSITSSLIIASYYGWPLSLLVSAGILNILSALLSYLICNESLGKAALIILGIGLVILFVDWLSAVPSIVYTTIIAETLMLMLAILIPIKCPCVPQCSYWLH